ncbi:indole-3-glycerol phosphate synthase [Alkalibaculum bacchi]|uniref:Indole-3-glycerol phosphate synthase n=1 Tax=Alkalibaculum bacchi TaxID=645887 RepID=A0A366IAC3_9FIRM|nr:indole-3-glycerol phosphate synthase TrpC [Alkalibaculum bacchi]RBP66687.1 indole-3-glycerol phosphate synthase [Alkalibaculum bacchi]
MSTILNQLAQYARVRVAADMEENSLDVLRQLCTGGAAPVREPFQFEKTLRKPGVSFICEVKKASPSKGVIAEQFPYVQIAQEYEQAGADCISCLTEPKWFLGSDEIFQEIRANVDTPMLRKDFMVDEYQIYQAKLMGADAVLLICAILNLEQLKKYLKLCDNLCLSAMVEVHNEQELQMAAVVGARIIGVNNRNLRDFSVDTGNSRHLRALAPADALFVAESGIQTVQDVHQLRQIGVDAVLVGESLMRAAHKSKMLHKLRGDR